MRTDLRSPKANYSKPSITQVRLVLEQTLLSGSSCNSTNGNVSGTACELQPDANCVEPV